MPEDEQKFLQETAVAIIDVFEKKGDVFAYVEKQRLESEEMLAIWSLLPSKVRTISSSTTASATRPTGATSSDRVRRAC